MASAARKDVCTKLHTVLKKHYPAPPKSGRTQVVEELVYATLLRNAGPVQAEALFILLSDRDNFVDWNEMRVTSVRELSGFLKGHPTAVATATRIKQILQWLFDHRYTFDCEDYRKKTLAEAEEFLTEMGGASPFVAQHLAQVVLGAHATPLDEASAAVLVALGALSPADAQKKGAEQIKAAVPKNKCVEFTALLQQFGAEFRAQRTPAVLKLLTSIASDASSRLSQAEAFLKEAMEKAAEAPAPIKPPPPVFPPRDGMPVPGAIGGDLDLMEGVGAPPELSDAASVDAALVANLRKFEKPSAAPIKSISPERNAHPAGEKNARPAADRNSHAGEKNSHPHVHANDKHAPFAEEKEPVKEKPAKGSSKGASPFLSSPFPVPDLPQKSTTRKRAPVDHDALDAAPPPPSASAKEPAAKEAPAAKPSHGKESHGKDKEKDSHAKGAAKEPAVGKESAKAAPTKGAPAAKEPPAKEPPAGKSHGKGKDAPKKKDASEADAPPPEAKGGKGGRESLTNLVAERSRRAARPSKSEEPPPPPAEEEEKPRKRRPK